MTSKKRGLGRTLETLLAGTAPVSIVPEMPSTLEASEAKETPEKTQPIENKEKSQFRHMPVEKLQRGQYQPRHDMDAESLQDLADSIKAQGVIQPILVRKLASGNFEIIAGERRWRAAQLAGLAEVPVLEKQLSDEETLAISLIENIQRENLNPLEEATALQRLANEFSLTHQEVAEAVGRSRVAVSNLVRLLTLNTDVKQLLENGDLEMGHARALLSLKGEEQSQTAKLVVGKGLSVRETEGLVRRLLSQKAPQKKLADELDPDTRQLQQDLSDRLGATVKIQPQSKGKGKLVISYNNLDELDGILAHIQ